MTLKAIVVDDERIARQRLRRLLEKDPDLAVAAECGTGADALRVIKAERPDVAFLDIQMPEINGFDVVTALGPGFPTVIVFVTAFDEHAIRAFDACALDYLLKPVAPERLEKTLSRVREHLRRVRAGAPSPAGAMDKSAETQKRFSVRSGQRTSFVAPDEIDWIEADGNYAILHVGEQNHMLRETMATLEAQLPAGRFIRVNRSAIVQLNRVKHVEASSGHHYAVLVTGERVPLTRSVREFETRLRTSS